MADEKFSQNHLKDENFLKKRGRKIKSIKNWKWMKNRLSWKKTHSEMKKKKKYWKLKKEKKLWVVNE